jgi:Cu2+-exporting ATPase
VLEPLLLEIEGMKCGGCVRAVEQRLLEQPGVQQASVNLLTRTAWVQLDSELASADQGEALPRLKQALAGLGYQANLREAGQEVTSRRAMLQHRHWWQQWRQLVVALALLLVSVLGHLALEGAIPPPAASDQPAVPPCRRFQRWRRPQHRRTGIRRR